MPSYEEMEQDEDFHETFMRLTQPDQLKANKEPEPPVHPAFLKQSELIISEARKGNQQAISMLEKMSAFADSCTRTAETTGCRAGD